MAILELNKFQARLTGGVPEGRYIFAGEEEYLIRHYMKKLAETIVPDEAFAVFNHMVYDGPVIDFAELTDAIKSPPMMSEYKLVEWRYADFSKMREDELSALEDIVREHEDYPYTVLAFSAVAGSFDFGSKSKPGKLIKQFGGSFDILRFEKSTDKQLHSWLARHFANYGIKLTLSVAEAMVERIGHSMDMLSREVEKLAIYARVHGKSEISVDDVNKVCPDVYEKDSYAFENALLDRNRQKLFASMAEMKQRRVDPLYIMAMAQKTYATLFDIVSLLKSGMGKDDIAALKKMPVFKVGLYINSMKKYNEDKLAEILDEAARVDNAMKSGGLSGYTAVEMFLSKYI